MAKIKNNTKQVTFQPVEKIKPWLVNKTTEARKLSEHRAARAARRWGAPAGVALLLLVISISLLLDQTSFQQAKRTLLKNPQDFEAKIVLAEEFLNHNQFEEAERILLLAQNQIDQSGEKVLGQKTNQVIEKLWQQKHYSDPQDIKKLVSLWEKIIEEKPDYRDGYLQLTYLHFKLSENSQAQKHLFQAIKLDPNYKTTKIIKSLLE